MRRKKPSLKNKYYEVVAAQETNFRLEKWEHECLYKTFRTAKSNIKQKFTLDFHDIVYIYLVIQKRRCALSGVEFNEIDNRPSLDRIDSSKGYTFENIHLTTVTVNMMKLNHMLDKFIKVCEEISSNKSNREKISKLRQADLGPGYRQAVASKAIREIIKPRGVLQHLYKS